MISLTLRGLQRRGGSVGKYWLQAGNLFSLRTGVIVVRRTPINELVCTLSFILILLWNILISLHDIPLIPHSQPNHSESHQSLGSSTVELYILIEFIIISSMGNEQQSTQDDFQTIRQISPNQKLARRRGDGQQCLLLSLPSNQLQKLDLSDRLQHRLSGTRSQYITPLLKWGRKNDNSLCGNRDTVELVFAETTPTLAEKLAGRRQSKQNFSQSEILYVIRNIALALRGLQAMKEEHGNVSLSTICVNTDVLLLDPIVGEADQDMLKQQQKTRWQAADGFPSPQRLRTYYDTLTSSEELRGDLFSLGIVALQLYYPNHDMHSLYTNLDPRFCNYKIDLNTLSFLVSGVHQQPLQNYLNILTSLQSKKRLAVYDMIKDLRIDPLTLPILKQQLINNKQSHPYSLNPQHTQTSQLNKVENRPVLLNQETNKLGYNPKVNLSNMNIQSNQPRQGMPYSQYPQSINFTQVIPSVQQKSMNLPSTSVMPSQRPISFTNQSTSVYSSFINPIDNTTNGHRFSQIPPSQSVIVNNSNPTTLPFTHLTNMNNNTSSLQNKPKIVPITLTQPLHIQPSIQTSTMAIPTETKASPKHSDPPTFKNLNQIPEGSSPIVSLQLQENNFQSKKLSFKQVTTALNFDNIPSNQNSNFVSQPPYVARSAQQKAIQSIYEEDAIIAKKGDTDKILESPPKEKIPADTLHPIAISTLSQQHEDIVETPASVQYPQSSLNNPNSQLSLGSQSSGPKVIILENLELQDPSPIKPEEQPQYVVEEYGAGTRYQGGKKNGLREGRGKFFYKQGSYYDGEWRTNKMHGYGILYYPSGKIAYEGEWSEDQFNGKGIVYNDQQGPLNGPFDFTDFNQIDDQWVKYEGQLEHDAKQGTGRLYLTNGESYEGQFSKDMVHGEGTFFSGKTQKRGIWEFGKLKKLL